MCYKRFIMRGEVGVRRVMNKGFWSIGEGVNNYNGGEENVIGERLKMREVEKRMIMIRYRVWSV